MLFGGGNHGAIGSGCTFLHLLEAHTVGHLAVDQVERGIGITAVFGYELGYQVADLLLTCGGNPIRCFAAIFAKSLPCYLADIGFKLFLVVHARFEHGISTHTGSSHCSHGAAQALPPAADCTCATAQFVIQPLQVAAVGFRRPRQFALRQRAGACQAVIGRLCELNFTADLLLGADTEPLIGADGLLPLPPGLCPSSCLPGGCALAFSQQPAQALAGIVLKLGNQF